VVAEEFSGGAGSAQRFNVRIKWLIQGCMSTIQRRGDSKWLLADRDDPKDPPLADLTQIVKV
jgi:hypothetical protein